MKMHGNRLCYKLLSLSVGFVVLFSITSPAFAYSLQELHPDVAADYAGLNEGLKAAFPEFASIIDSNRSSIYSESEVTSLLNDSREIVLVESRAVSETESYGLILYNDGTYSAINYSNILLGAEFSGGSWQTGSGFRQLRNVTLTAWDNLQQGHMTIYPITYTLAQGGYGSFQTLADATFVYPGQGAVNDPISPSVTRWSQDINGPATVNYVGSGNADLGGVSTSISVSVTITVGDNICHVLVNNIQVI